MLLDRDVVVTAGNRLAVFLYLNCFAIQNADRDFLAAEFDCPVRGRDPSFKRGLKRFVIHHDFNISFLERLDRHLIGSLWFGSFLSGLCCYARLR